jgi:endonuclease IV
MPAAPRGLKQDRVIRERSVACTVEELRRCDRLGVCFDTCHVFASGYELRTRSGYARTIARFEEAVGLERVRVLHLHDSLRPLGSNRDRRNLTRLRRLATRGSR